MRRRISNLFLVLASAVASWAAGPGQGFAVNPMPSTSGMTLYLDSRYASDISTNVSSQIAQWNDRSGGANHAAQATDANKPLYMLDPFGVPAVMWPTFTDALGAFSAWLTVPNASTFASLNTRSLTVYVVACNYNSVTRNTGGATVMGINSTGAAMELLGTSGANYIPGRLAGNGGNGPAHPMSAKLYPPLNRAVWCVAASAGSTVSCVNYDSGSGSAPTSVTFGGCDIGRRQNATFPFVGAIYAVLVFNTTHDAATRQLWTQWLIGEFGVRTSFDGVLAARGDSITAGTWSTRWYAWANWLNQLKGGRWKIHNCGISSSQFTTGSEGASNDATVIDSLYDSSTDSEVAVFLGTNDIGLGAQTGAQTFARLQTWATARDSVWGASHVHPITVLDRNTFDTQVTDYNALVRAGDASYGTVWDIGKDASPSTVFSGATSSLNTTYYNADGLHPQDDGTGTKQGHQAIATLLSAFF